MANEHVERKLTAILAADIAGYSRLMGVDEEGTLRALKGHRRALVDPNITEHHGRIVKTTGDGMLVEFASAVDAVRCAVDIQSGMLKRNAEVPPGRRIEFRVGINVGDIIVDGDDIFGDGVNVAARLEAMCEPGSILVSRQVRDPVRDKLPLSFEDLGEQALRNISRPVRTYRVRLEAEEKRVVDSKSASTANTPALPNKPSIAVLPFQNMSDDQGQEYFADGMAEDIISALSRVKGFFVIARNSSFTFRSRAVDIKQVARELGVRYVLEGSVRRSGNRLRITVQLIEGPSNAHIWSDHYDGGMTEVFDLQDRITESIIGALEPTIRSAEIERSRRKRPENLEAYDLVMQALPLFWNNARETHSHSIALLERAMTMDPGYALAAALCAWSHAVNAVWLWADQPARERDTALRLAATAASLDSEDPFVLALLSAVYANCKQLPEAAPLIDKSLAIDPNSAFAWHQRGWLTLYLSDPDRAIECFERGMRISPLDPYNFNPMIGIGNAHIVARRFEEGVIWVKKGIAASPAASWAWRHIVGAYVVLGRMEEAKEALAKFRASNPGATVSLIRESLINQNAEWRQMHLEGLRKAGLPE